MAKLRIMHLNLFVGYDGPSRGIIGQIKYMDKDRFQPVICEIKPTQHPELISHVKDLGCEHICLNRNRFYDISIFIKLVGVLRKYRIDVLNTHNALACWYGNIAAKLVSIPVVFTLRNNQWQNYKLLFKKKPFYEAARLLDRITMRFADKTVAVSKRLERFYVEHERVPQEKILTINNAIDLEPIEEFRRNNDRQCLRGKIGIDADKVVVGIVGDLVERKGHSCLIEAANIIVKEQKNVAFLIVGDGPLMADLQRKIDSYKLANHFVFTGQVKNVFNYLMSMDIFVLPSFAEGISRALMESMAMGIPSVCSAIDGNLEAVVEGETGFLFPVNDEAILTEKLLTLIQNSEQSKKMGEKSQKLASKMFDIKKMAGGYEDLYLELINSQLTT